MSRSGYSDALENWSLIRWRGAVASAIRGKAGQAFIRETIAALDALPMRCLAAGEFAAHGTYCTLGAVAHARGIPCDELDPEDPRQVAARLGIPRALAAELMFLNDEPPFFGETQSARFERMRALLAGMLADAVADKGGP